MAAWPLAPDTFIWLELPATMESFTPLQTFVGDGARAAKLSDEQVWKIELIFEELVTNVIRHGYGDGPRGDVSVGYAIAADHTFFLRMMSGGIPFNPLLKPALQLTDDISAREPGGLGIHLVKTLADAVAYEYKESLNVISFAVAPPGTGTA